MAFSEAGPGPEPEPDLQFEGKITEIHKAKLATMQVGGKVSGELEGRRYEITLLQPITPENPAGGLRLDYDN